MSLLELTVLLLRVSLEMNAIDLDSVALMCVRYCKTSFCEIVHSITRWSMQYLDAIVHEPSCTSLQLSRKDWKGLEREQKKLAFQTRKRAVSLSSRVVLTKHVGLLGTFADAQALVLPVMRVRHESSQELAAMARSLMKTALPQFSQASSPLPKGPPVAHLAEPFDGISRSVMVTPLLAAHLQVCEVEGCVHVD